MACNPEFMLQLASCAQTGLDTYTTTLDNTALCACYTDVDALNVCADNDEFVVTYAATAVSICGLGLDGDGFANDNDVGLGLDGFGFANDNDVGLDLDGDGVANDNDVGLGLDGLGFGNDNDVGCSLEMMASMQNCATMDDIAAQCECLATMLDACTGTASFDAMYAAIKTECEANSGVGKSILSSFMVAVLAVSYLATMA